MLPLFCVLTAPISFCYKAANTNLTCIQNTTEVNDTKDMEGKFNTNDDILIYLMQDPDNEFDYNVDLVANSIILIGFNKKIKFSLSEYKECKNYSLCKLNVTTSISILGTVSMSGCHVTNFINATELLTDSTSISYLTVYCDNISRLTQAESLDMLEESRIYTKYINFTNFLSDHINITEEKIIINDGSCQIYPKSNFILEAIASSKLAINTINLSANLNNSLHITHLDSNLIINTEGKFGYKNLISTKYSTVIITPESHVTGTLILENSTIIDTDSKQLNFDILKLISHNQINALPQNHIFINELDICDHSILDSSEEIYLMPSILSIPRKCRTTNVTIGGDIYIKYHKKADTNLNINAESINIDFDYSFNLVNLTSHIKVSRLYAYNLCVNLCYQFIIPELSPDYFDVWVGKSKVLFTGIILISHPSFKVADSASPWDFNSPIFTKERVKAVVDVSRDFNKGTDQLSVVLLANPFYTYIRACIGCTRNDIKKYAIEELGKNKWYDHVNEYTREVRIFTHSAKDIGSIKFDKNIDSSNLVLTFTKSTLIQQRQKITLADPNEKINLNIDFSGAENMVDELLFEGVKVTPVGSSVINVKKVSIIDTELTKPLDFSKVEDFGATIDYYQQYPNENETTKIISVNNCSVTLSEGTFALDGKSLKGSNFSLVLRANAEVDVLTEPNKTVGLTLLGEEGGSAVFSKEFNITSRLIEVTAKADTEFRISTKSSFLPVAFRSAFAGTVLIDADTEVLMPSIDSYYGPLLSFAGSGRGRVVVPEVRVTGENTIRFAPNMQAKSVYVNSEGRVELLDMTADSILFDRHAAVTVAGGNGVSGASVRFIIDDPGLVHAEVADIAAAAPIKKLQIDVATDIKEPFECALIAAGSADFFNAEIVVPPEMTLRYSVDVRNGTLFLVGAPVPAAPSPTPGPSGPGAGMIAALTVGGLAFVAIVGAVIYFVVVRKENGIEV